MPLFSPADPHHHPYHHPPPHHHPPSTTLTTSTSHPPNFFFRRRTAGKLSWSLLSSVSLSSIISTVNVDLLQEHVDLITYADINESDLAQATDAQIVHLVRLAQLTIEYLLNVQNFLLRQHRHLHRSHQHTAQQLDDARAALQDRETHIERLTAENKFLKKLNRHIQSAQGAPASPVKGGGGVGTGGMEVMGVHTCEYCRASFVNEVYLAGHIGRRHPDKAHLPPSHSHSKPRSKHRPPPTPSSDSSPPPHPPLDASAESTGTRSTACASTCSASATSSTLSAASCRRSGRPSLRLPLLHLPLPLPLPHPRSRRWVRSGWISTRRTWSGGCGRRRWPPSAPSPTSATSWRVCRTGWTRS